ncbi:uncharacterized protein LOC141908491 [Tubulanus polymorphus]|uniref:uncharacterized protein LOC141908491 n=1 Tax=Tubulanus polymorphus TaxID=672921 RepID=UPI003DA36477
MPTPSSLQSTILDNFESNFSDDSVLPREVIRYTLIAKSVFVYGAPFILLLGIIGNTLTVVIFNRKSLRNTSYSWLFTCLAVSDSGYLCTGLVRRWVVFYRNYDFRMWHWFVCTLHYFLTYVFSQLSPWMLILITIERCVSVVAPMRAKIICSRKRMIYASILMTLIILLANSHMLYGIRIVLPFGCEEKDDDYSDFWFDYWVHVELFLTTLGPFMILLLCNAVIIISIKRSQMRQAAMTNTATSSGSSGGGASTKTRKQNQTESITVMLVATNFMFVFTSLPFSVYLLLPTFEHKLVDACFSLLSYVNYAINFWLYCFTGRRFRTELYELCRCRPKKTATQQRRSLSSQSIATSVATSSSNSECRF